jgi:hypothetical protein
MTTKSEKSPMQILMQHLEMNGKAYYKEIQEKNVRLLRKYQDKNGNTLDNLDIWEFHNVSYVFCFRNGNWVFVPASGKGTEDDWITSEFSSLGEKVIK